MVRKLRTFVCLTLLGVLATAARTQESTEPWVYGPDEKVEGKTPGEWAAAHFRWAFSAPRDRSPVTDKTGEFAGQGQSGPVWFLGGNFGGTMRRQLTVPAGKPICSPILYTFNDVTTPRKPLPDFTDMEVTLDGKTLRRPTRFRVAAQPFEFTGPGAEEAIHPLLAGTRTYRLEGLWFMLKPLTPGDHTLRVQGRVRGGSFELDITYQMKVVERKRT